MKGIKGRNLVIAVTVAFTLLYFIATNIYSSTNSVLFLHLFVSCLFFAATNALLILLKRIGIKREKKPRTVSVSRKRNAKASAAAEPEKEQDAAQGSPKPVPEKLEKLAKKLEKFNKSDKLVWKKLLRYALYAFIVFSCVNNTAFSLTGVKGDSEVTVGNAVFAFLALIVFIVLDKFCKHSEDNTPFVTAMLKNCRLFIKLISFQLIATTLCTALCATEILTNHVFINYLFIAFFIYYALFTILSIVIIAIKKDSVNEPVIKIVIPFSRVDSSHHFVDFLENSTGITMRSLWSVKYIKKIAPVTVFSIAALLWLSTGVIQLGPNEQAAVYRLGTLRDKILDSGLHFVLPAPFDKVEIYDTESVQKMTIGYKSSEPSDNIWTSSHGSEEYKLLLGNGDELVSINLRLEYKIGDLKKYVTTATKPEAILEALAYELVTDKTIETDLATLLSADRDAFADNFLNELREKLTKHDTGLEVVCVILESIHPPVEISSVYQQIISAEITAEKYILDAQASANVKLADAQAKYDTAVNTANSEHSRKVAAAKTSVAEFTASLQAYNKYGDQYKYQKYLGAVREAYGKANLVILGDGVDRSAIYFGSISPNGSLTPQTDGSADEPTTKAPEETTTAAPAAERTTALAQTSF